MGQSSLPPAGIKFQKCPLEISYPRRPGFFSIEKSGRVSLWPLFLSITKEAWGTFTLFTMETWWGVWRDSPQKFEVPPVTVTPRSFSLSHFSASTSLFYPVHSNTLELLITVSSMEFKDRKMRADKPYHGELYAQRTTVNPSLPTERLK